MLPHIYHAQTIPGGLSPAKILLFSKKRVIIHRLTEKGEREIFIAYLVLLPLPSSYLTPFLPSLTIHLSPFLALLFVVDFSLNFLFPILSALVRLYPSTSISFTAVYSPAHPAFVQTVTLYFFPRYGSEVYSSFSFSAPLFKHCVVMPTLSLPHRGG